MENKIEKFCAKKNAKQYFYKEKAYKILHKAKMKNEITREWYDVIVYQNIEGMVFCREEAEFFNLFK